MNPNLIREVQAYYNVTRELLSEDGLEENQQNPGLNQVEYRNTFKKNLARYLEKDQMMALFKNL